MSKLETALNDLLYDWNAVSNFFEDPHGMLQSEGLCADEINAVLNQDEQRLSVLGIDNALVSAALSGAHSKTCVR